MTECIVCNSTQALPLYNGILKCQNCGHVYADLAISDSELFELYRKNYFFGEEYSDYLADKAVIQKNFNLRMKALNAL